MWPRGKRGSGHVNKKWKTKEMARGVPGARGRKDGSTCYKTTVGPKHEVTGTRVLTVKVAEGGRHKLGE